MEIDQDIKFLRLNLQKQAQASTYINNILNNHSELDSKTIHLIKVALAIQEGSLLHIEANIREAINDGLKKEDIIIAACYGLTKHNGDMVMHLQPILDAINLHNSNENCRSTCFWNDEY